MDQGARQIREKNPRENASILSVITFFYTYVLFKKGYKKDLEDEDVYEIVPKLSSKTLGDRLEQKWKISKMKMKKPSVAKLLISVFGTKYFCMGLVQLCMKTTIILIQPRALGKLVAYFKPDQTAISRNDAYVYAALVIGLNLLSCVYNHNYVQWVTEYGISVRTSFVALIYRKALKLGPLAFSEVTMGRIVTLITKDVLAFETALIFLNDVWIGLIQTAIIGYIIYSRIGVSVLAGIGFFLLVIPLQVYVGKKTSLMRLKAAKKTDDRLQITTESFSAIKIIKMYTWENFFGAKINDARGTEIKSLKALFYLKSVILITGGLVSNISFYFLLMTYIWTGHNVDAEIVYFVQSCFFSLKSFITTSIPFGIGQSAELYASIKRIQKFLYAEEATNRQQPQVISKPRVLLRHVSVTIKNTEILKDVSLSCNSGLLAITGSVGSGKSSILKTILNDLPISNGDMLVEGSISYASEDPWLFPSTIKQNILFGQEFNEKRYNEVLNVCALKLDLNQFEKGDQTVVGDRGVNLSKGQQTRINLARAVYKNSDIYLLDDCLSTLDSHVNMYIFKNCIRDFLKDKIVILVTNNVNHIKQMYGRNTLFVESGTTLSLEEQNETLDKRITYYIDDVDLNYFEGEEEKHDEEEEEADDVHTELLKDKQPAKNLYHEEKQSGKVSLDVYLRYYRFGGGIIFVLLLLLAFVVCQGVVSYSDKLVSKWVNIEPQISKYVVNKTTNSTAYEEVVGKRDGILKLYSALMVATIILMFTRVFINFYYSLKASRKLHKVITYSILNSFMTFFDGHYIGNIINRFSKDLATTDETIPHIIYENFRCVLGFLGIIYLIASVNLMFLIPAGVLVLKLYFIRRFYLPTSRNVKRLESATRSPVVGYLNATLEGLTTVRAYEKQALLQDEFDRHLDLYTSSYFMMQCTNRAFGFTLDLVCSAFIAATVVSFFFGGTVKAGDVGLAISQAMMLTGMLQWMLRQASELENNMTSVERVLEYADIKTENKEIGQVLDNWPSRGKIEYRGVSLTYSTTKEQVLNNINFVVEPNEKVGIVGRTGAGKSSIISSLFRLYKYEGKILIDDVDIATLSLDFLRSNIAIIPQDPILFSGTLRSNIDPTGKYSDSTIWDAIEKVNLKHLFDTLEEKITDSGSIYSSGQRQLICLARALVSKNKIIVLDEATASMDPETCTLLHTTIKHNFSNCTVLTIAHRINTVSNSDKVIVVDAGRIVEHDAPDTLLENKNGMFYKMVKKSGLLH